MKQEVLPTKNVDIIKFKPLKQLSVPEYVALFKDLGLACFPLIPNDKRPLVKWGGVTPENCDYESITGNYGVKLSRYLNVLDVDPRNGGYEGFYRLVDDMGGYFKPEMAVKTQGGGYHFYFENPDGEKLPNKPRHKYPGIDIQGEGQYVVGPGSEVNGRPYLFGEVEACYVL